VRPITIWLNKNLSGTFNVIETLRAARRNETFRIVCSHTQEDAPALRIADVAEIERRGPCEAAYLDYCEEIIRRHQVDVFIPGKMLRPIVAARSRFEALGVRLVYAAEPETLRLLENKASLYAAVPPGLAPLPDYRVVNDLAGFDAACAWLHERGHAVCFKPAVSMFGVGFRVLTEEGTALGRLLSGDAVKIGVREARLFLGEAPSFRDVLVLQYLPGPERSVDCLARHGELACGVVRRKPMGTEGGQVLEDNPAIVEIVRRLTRHFGLNGIFNVQFRDADGEPRLLEINPRMSGGLHYACLSGVALPYWAVRLALETAEPGDVPQPKTGIRVGQVNKPIVL
jgi:biotin carboxylase